MENKQVTIFLCIDSKIVNVPLIDKITAEQVIIEVCKKLGIGPLARHLFALRVYNTKIWLPLNTELTGNSFRYEFRIRYKVPNFHRLKKIDIKAYDYYFQQSRFDVRNYMVTDLVYDSVKKELLGLGVADMYRVMKEKDLSVDAVLNDYKKFISKEVIKHHPIFFIKKPIRQALEELKKRGHDSWVVKRQYLEQLESMAPEYLTEEYNALIDRDRVPCRAVLRVSPYNKDFPGIRVSYGLHKKEWNLLSTIEDLCFISISNDRVVQISRKSGIPTNLKFESLQEMHSFVSLLDGYYRFMIKWTFSLCKEINTPTLDRLLELRCHGPVGGEFSYAKLEEKTQSRRGCYILRESELKYNVYYIDVCIKDNAKPKTYKLEKIGDEEYIFNDDVTRYKNIFELRKAYNKPENLIYLNECLPPSEYDISPVLLCLPDDQLSDSYVTDSDTVNAFTSSPVIINPKSLQVYKGQTKASSSGVTVVHRSIWKLAKGKKLEVALKVLKQKDNENNCIKEFIQCAGQWAGLREGAKGIVRLWGISLGDPTAMVLEYAKFGPLSQFLTECRTGIREQLDPVDLLEAASHLASALWHMEEHNMVHGKIRCSKLLVYARDDKSFIVKLSDPGIHSSYTRKDIHWLPIECYSNFEMARNSHKADVWAFGTTVWEIYMQGESTSIDENLDPMEFYLSGKRLKKPAYCPDNIYKILWKCWYRDPHQREKPQAILRDINQLLYDNSRRKHVYTTLFSDTSSFAETDTAARDDCSVTDMTTMSYSSGGSSNSQWSGDFGNNEILTSDLTNLTSLLSTNTSFSDDIGSLAHILEIDQDLNIVLQGKIGVGFYGEVYKGTYIDKEGLEQKVAIKILKTKEVSNVADFEREISIMKTLKHPNIVQILDYRDDDEYLIIMEYIAHSSLNIYIPIHRENITPYQLLNYALEIARGMEYLAQQHIVHRDLAARNVLVVDENHVKISDFGLAQFVGENNYYILRTNRDLPIKWYAPESLKDGKFSTRSDVWSYGITLYEMFSYGEEPNLPITLEDMVGQLNGQLHQQTILDALEKGLRLPCPQFCPQSIYARIMYPCWKKIPSDRPTFSILCSDIHDLLKSL